MCLHITGHLNFGTYHSPKPVFILLNIFLNRSLECILLCRAHLDADDIAYIKGLGYHHSTTRFYRIITLSKLKNIKDTPEPFFFPASLIAYVRRLRDGINGPFLKNRRQEVRALKIIYYG